MKRHIFVLLLFVFTGCQSTGRMETSVNPYHLEVTEVKVVVEFRTRE